MHPFTAVTDTTLSFCGQQRKLREPKAHFGESPGVKHFGRSICGKMPNIAHSSHGTLSEKNDKNRSRRGRLARRSERYVKLADNEVRGFVAS
jgi:hypothetical protein